VTDSEPKPTETTASSAAPPAPPSEPMPEQPAAPTEPAAPVAEAPLAEAPVAVAEPAESAPTARAGTHLGTGRRKSSVARVRLMAGSGQMLVNGREAERYFTEPQDKLDIFAPLELTGVRRQWDVKVTVHGGGHSGQAGAVRLGVARALLKAYDQFEVTLRDAGFLTRDARRVERKKPGQRKARRRFQFSKR
jgi:small subunit ribosomal protein S9